MKLNATQKNLLTAAGLGAMTATPAAAVAVLGVVVQPIVAATVFTKGRKLPARIAQGAIGATLALIGVGIGAGFNPEIAATTQPTETKVEIVKEAPAPKAEVVEEAPAPKAEVVKKAPATKTYEYPTVQAAQQEICDAGTQYLMDVAQGYMTVEQGKNEVRSYAAYLSKNSPASASELVSIGVGCSKLWN